MNLVPFTSLNFIFESPFRKLLCLVKHKTNRTSVCFRVFPLFGFVLRGREVAIAPINFYWYMVSFVSGASMGVAAPVFGSKAWDIPGCYLFSAKAKVSILESGLLDWG